MGFFDFIKEAGEKLFHGSAAAVPIVPPPLFWVRVHVWVLGSIYLV